MIGLRKLMASNTELYRQIFSSLTEEEKAETTALSKAICARAMIRAEEQIKRLSENRDTFAGYTAKDYADAMVKARNEVQELYSQIMNYSIDHSEWLDMLARAVGIQTSRESWWDIKESEQRQKILDRIAHFRKLKSNSTQS